MSTEFKPGDRVLRKGVSGPRGTVQRIRVETTQPSLKESPDGKEAPAVTVTVVWDNGTTSHFVPNGIEKL